MKNINPIRVEEFQALLRRNGSGVLFDPLPIPAPIDTYTAFRATLESLDLDRIFLWPQFKADTAGNTGKLTDALPESASKERVKPLIEGDATKGWGPIDLRKAVEFEPMLVTNDLVRGSLQAIDGNHRMIAQFITGKSFDGVTVYVCVHPMMMNWPYVIQSARDWYQKSTSANVTVATPPSSFFLMAD